MPFLIYITDLHQLAKHTQIHHFVDDARLRHYINPKLLRTMYYVTFEFHLQYECQLWGKTQKQVLQNTEKIQNKKT